MAETAQKTVEQSSSEPQQVVADFASRATVPPERMAWLVLVVAFVLFCVLSISSAVAVYAFLFRSSVAIPTVLHVGKGTVGLTGSDFVETVERELEDITNSATTISTDSLSQATIQFRDTPLLDVTTPPLLTSITLQSNTTVTFDRAARPRFDWSLAEQSIRLSRLAGSLDILVTNASDKPFLLSISTAQGIALEFHGSGRYRVSATVDEVRLHNLAGQASAYFTDEANSVTDVEPGNELVVRLGNRTFEHRPGAIEALAGSSFSLMSILGIQGEAQELPQGWDCFITQDNFPPGGCHTRHSTVEPEYACDAWTTPPRTASRLQLSFRRRGTGRKPVRFDQGHRRLLSEGPILESMRHGRQRMPADDSH